MFNQARSDKLKFILQKRSKGELNAQRKQPPFVRFNLQKLIQRMSHITHHIKILQSMLFAVINQLRTDVDVHTRVFYIE